jgi:hypothetical protein
MTPVTLYRGRTAARPSEKSFTQGRSDDFSERACRAARAVLKAHFGFVQTARISYDLSVTATEQDILRTLTELDRLVKTMAAANPKPDLKPVFARLDALTRQLPPQTEPDLLHYLHRKSYEKARFFLEGRNAENTAGSCGHQ